MDDDAMCKASHRKWSAFHSENHKQYTQADHTNQWGHVQLVTFDVADSVELNNIFWKAAKGLVCF